MSEKQLNVVAFSDTDFPLLKRAPRNDHTGVLSTKYKADAGGPECTTFLNAQFTSGSYYHGLHEVDKGYTLTTTGRTVQLESAAVSYSSAREAEQVINDARTSVRHCSNLRYRLHNYSFSFEEITSLPIPLTGDDSTAFQESWRLNGGKAEPWATELIRVGTVVVSVNAVSSPDPIELLRQTGKRAAAELRQEEVRAADAPARQTR
ncbi:sensor domain-containing protein [Streptomyces sp. NPDC001816]|uniref:sensor domain-containing protein n=1 Tax=Streptomyces sp. NPDC001816 TaxID=3364612 RepID=UPI00369F1574